MKRRDSIWFGRLICVSLLVLITAHFANANDKNAIGSDPVKRGACTSACVVNNGYAVLGSNYDSFWTGGQIYFNKRGIKKSNRYMEFNNPNGTVIEWTSKYASVVFTVGFYQFPWAGMNERGLAYGTMRSEEITPDPADPRAHMASSFWWQYVLDTCETVEEVMATDLLIKIDTVDHFLFTDRYGNAAVVEFSNGHMVFHTGDDLGIAVLANDPYEVNYNTWTQYAHTSQDYSSMNDSERRFCIAADRVDDFTSRSDQGAVDYVFSILRDAGWTPDNISMWSIVFDTKNLRIYYNTLHDRAIRYIDILSFDLSGKLPAKMLHVHGPQRGDSAKDMYVINWEEVRNSAIERLRQESEELPEGALEQLLELIKGFAWTGDRQAEGWSVSPTSGKKVESVRCALNPATGDVLVTWAERDSKPGVSSRIRSALIYKTLDGTYCAAEYHTLNVGDGYKGNPYPAYLSSLGKFLVVWDQSDPAKPTAASGIYGRFISGRGLPGKLVTRIVGGNTHNESPQIYERLSNSSAPASEASIDLVYFTAKASKKRLKKPSLNIATIDSTLRVKKNKVLIKGETRKKVPEIILPTGMGAVVDQTILLPIEFDDVQKDGSIIHFSKIISVDGENRLADNEVIGVAGDTTPRLGVHPEGGKATVIGSSLAANSKYTNSLFTLDSETGFLEAGKSYEEKRKSVDLHSLLLSTSASSKIPPGKLPIGYQFSATVDGRIYRRNVSSTGRLTGGYVKFVEKAKGIDGIAGTQVMQLGNSAPSEALEMLVIWHSATSLEKNEIRMKAMKVNR